MNESKVCAKRFWRKWIRSGAVVIKIVIRPKSSFQKDVCLFCNEPSIFEAVGRMGNIMPLIRCCKKDSCRDEASKLAKKYIINMF